MQDRANVYDSITQKIISQLEAGTVPWVQPWESRKMTGAMRMPHNAGTRRPYSGINVILLWIAETEGGYSSASWLTFKQALELGGAVRKGEKGTQVVYADRFVPKAEKEKHGDDAKSVPFLKTFTVFNVAQIDGLPESVTGGAAMPVHESLILPRVEQLISASKVSFQIGGGRAFYSPEHDCVVVPPPASYFEPINWHRTALHEMGHATGHKSRLARDFSGRFGSDSYAVEELVAEMTAAYTCASLGIVPTVRHADYLASWLRVLKSDNRAIVQAASAASKAADWLLQFAPSEAEAMPEDERIAA